MFSDPFTAKCRHLTRQTLSILLTTLAVATTLATSPGHDFSPSSSPEPFRVNVWDSSTVMGEDEHSVHLFLSFPTDLLDTHEHAIAFHFTVFIDQLEHQVSPQTSWGLRVGDSAQDSLSFSTDLRTTNEPEGSPFLVWEFVDSLEGGSLPISADCDEDGCIPCDHNLSRCDVMLTVTRDGATLPRMKVDVSGSMTQVDTSGGETGSQPASARERF